MTSASRTPSRNETSPFPVAGICFAAAIALPPALLSWHLHALWNPSGDYAYGWAVPLLGVLLYKSRWDDRPTASPPMTGAAFIAIVLALVLLPARWLQEAAPERGIATWTYAIACTGIPLAILSLAGGAAWLRWLSFPFAFLLTAVPWPHTFETLISNSLMRGTAGVTVEILCFIGIPSVQAGNLVHIETGIVDIAEACSGIRSLQAMVMISLFLGELFRLKLAKRLLLVATGLAVTLGANIIRTVVLSCIGRGEGLVNVDQYHDSAGLAVLILSLAITLLAAFRLRPAKHPPIEEESPGPRLTYPLKLSLILLVWLFATEISVEAWYRWREPKWNGWSWSIRWPEQADDFHFINIPKRSLQLLMCDESRGAKWKGPNATEWSLYSVRWNPGNVAAEEAKVHRPDVCLNAEGAIMEKDLGTHLEGVGAMQIPFHSYIFRLDEKTLYVFFCLYEELPGGPAASTPRFEAVDMFQRAMQGRRHAGEQSFELALSGYGSEQDARDAFEAQLDSLMAPAAGSP